MNTLQLDSVLRSDPYSANLYRGTYARDDFPKNAVRKGLYICNTDKRSEPGTHWIACYLTKSGDNLYFDSFGLEPYLPEFKSVLLSRPNSAVSYCQASLQSYDTVTCGHYCLIFCLLIARGYSLDKIVAILNSSPDSHARDHSVEQFITSLFPIANAATSDTIHTQVSKAKCDYENK